MTVEREKQLGVQIDGWQDGLSLSPSFFTSLFLLFLLSVFLSLSLSHVFAHSSLSLGLCGFKFAS